MNRFLQLHLLTSYPPANLNRDDLGRPKSALMGGFQRLRVSSQSLKRAWRKSDTFVEALNGHVGTRTKEMGRAIYQNLVARGVGDKDAHEWAGRIAAQFGKQKKPSKDDPYLDLEIEQLAHFGPEEHKAIEFLTMTLAERHSVPTEEELKLLRKPKAAADIALFGRMLAANPAYNVDATAQVAHAVTVHGAAIEDDFFTAVDDLNTGEEDRGSGHMGELGFGAGLFYLYVCVDRESLLENLGNDRTLMDRTLGAVLECAATIAPTGKQNSFASRAYSSYILAEKGNRQPRSLAVAFLKPVRGDDMLGNAVRALEETRVQMERCYGNCAAEYQVMNTQAAEGPTLEDLKAFTTGD